MKGLRLFHLLILAVLAVMTMLAPSRAQASVEAVEIGVADSLTTDVLTVTNSSYGEFYAPAGIIRVRAIDDDTTTTTRCFVKYFATNPSSSDLDASTREKTGVVLQEGDTLDFYLSSPGWIAIDGAVGTSNIAARQLE